MDITRWVALMIQLEKFVCCGGVVAYTNYLYPARWGWIKNFKKAKLYKRQVMNLIDKFTAESVTSIVQKATFNESLTNIADRYMNVSNWFDDMIID